MHTILYNYQTLESHDRTAIVPQNSQSIHLRVQKWSFIDNQKLWHPSSSLRFRSNSFTFKRFSSRTIHQANYSLPFREPGELRRTEAISRHRLRSQSCSCCSYLLEIPLGWTARVARLYFVRFGNGRPRADVTFLHRYVPRMYVRRISNEGEFSWNEITCANACATRCWNCNRDENGIRIIVDVTSFLIRWKGEVEVLETGRTCRFVRLATVYRFGRNLSL